MQCRKLCTCLPPAEGANTSINDSGSLKCLVLILNVHLLLSSHLCLKSLCFFWLDHCRSDFFFLKKQNTQWYKAFLTLLLNASTPVSLFLIYSSIFKYSKTKFGDKDKLKTNIGHQTVTFTFFLLNSCLPSILISLFMYCGAIFSFFDR